MTFEPVSLNARWTLDQALLWVATRNIEWINEARSGPRRSRDTLTWMMARFEVAFAGDSGPARIIFVMPHHEAETALLAALHAGTIIARQDEDVIAPWWFADAWFEHRGNPDRMILRRRRDKPLVLAEFGDGTALAQSGQEAEPRLDAREVVSIFRATPCLPGGADSPEGEDQQAPLATSRRPDELRRETPSGRPHPTKQDVRSAYLEWVSLHERKRPPSRDEDEAYLRNRFPTLTGMRKRARELRGELAPHWGKPGPRRPYNSGENPGK